MGVDVYICQRTLFLRMAHPHRRINHPQLLTIHCR